MTNTTLSLTEASPGLFCSVIPDDQIFVFSREPLALPEIADLVPVQGVLKRCLPGPVIWHVTPQSSSGHFNALQDDTHQVLETARKLRAAVVVHLSSLHVYWNGYAIKSPCETQAHRGRLSAFARAHLDAERIIRKAHREDKSIRFVILRPPHVYGGSVRTALNQALSSGAPAPNPNARIEALSFDNLLNAFWQASIYGGIGVYNVKGDVRHMAEWRSLLLEEVAHRPTRGNFRLLWNSLNKHMLRFLEWARPTGNDSRLLLSDLSLNSQKFSREILPNSCASLIRPNYKKGESAD